MHYYITGDTHGDFQGLQNCLVFGKAGMQDIIMLKARKAISELCLKTMMRYVKKQSRS